MSFSQSSITSVSPPVQQGAQLLLSWTSSAPPGTVYQVYLNQQLAWTGVGLSCTIPVPDGNFTDRHRHRRLGRYSDQLSDRTASSPRHGRRCCPGWGAHTRGPTSPVSTSTESTRLEEGSITRPSWRLCRPTSRGSSPTGLATVVSARGDSASRPARIPGHRNRSRAAHGTGASKRSTPLATKDRPRRPLSRSPRLRYRRTVFERDPITIHVQQLDQAIDPELERIAHLNLCQLSVVSCPWLALRSRRVGRCGQQAFPLLLFARRGTDASPATDNGQRTTDNGQRKNGQHIYIQRAACHARHGRPDLERAGECQRRDPGCPCPSGAFAVVTTEVPSATLNVHMAAGNYLRQDGTIGTYAGSPSQAMTASATNYLYLDLTNSGAWSSTRPAFPLRHTSGWQPSSPERRPSRGLPMRESRSTFSARSLME